MSTQIPESFVQTSPAQSPSLETAILGCLMLNPQAIPDCAGGLEADYFSIEEHQHIYYALLFRHNNQEAIDACLVADTLRANGVLEAVGDISYIKQCTVAAAPLNALPSYLVSLRQLRSDRKGGKHRGMKDWNEARAAQIFQSRIPPLKCVESEWYCYDTGAWRNRKSMEFAPLAMQVMHPDLRAADKAKKIIAHSAYERQVPQGHFRGAYRFDKGDILLNVKNGVLRVSKDQPPTLEPHSPEHRFAGQFPVNYTPGATCDLFRTTLSAVLPDPDDLVLLQSFSGYILYPDCRMETVLICHGEGGTGKSTVAEAILSVLSQNDYDPDKDSGKSDPNDLVHHLSLGQVCDPKGYYVGDLQYAALNMSTELDAAEIEDSANFKKLASGEKIISAPKFCSARSFSTGCKMWFLANQMPMFSGGSSAELRRLRFLRFDKRPLVADAGLKRQLKAEQEGIFLWMLEGLVRIMQTMEIPLGGKHGRDARTRFGISNDPIGTFVKECCVLDPEAHEDKERLTAAYEAFLEEFGFPATFATSLFRRLYERHPSVKQVRLRAAGGVRVQMVGGLQLRSSMEDGDVPVDY